MAFATPRLQLGVCYSAFVMLLFGSAHYQDCHEKESSLPQEIHSWTERLKKHATKQDIKLFTRHGKQIGITYYGNGK